jgi:hypothetical protein
MAINDRNPNFKKVSKRQPEKKQSPISFFLEISINVGINALYGQGSRQLIRQFGHNPPLHSRDVQKLSPGTSVIEVMP